MALPNASVVAPVSPPAAPLELRLTLAPWTGPDPLLTVTCTDPVPAVRVGTVVGEPIVAETAATRIPTAGDVATTSTGPVWVRLNWYVPPAVVVVLATGNPPTVTATGTPLAGPPPASSTTPPTVATGTVRVNVTLRVPGPMVKGWSTVEPWTCRS